MPNFKRVQGAEKIFWEDKILTGKEISQGVISGFGAAGVDNVFQEMLSTTPYQISPRQLPPRPTPARSQLYLGPAI